MDISYKCISGFPKLAWIADIHGSCIDVLHGSNVELNNSYFLEGAWNGEFHLGDFCESDWFCGTGGKLFDRGISFSTPSHVTYGLYYYVGKNVYVSNSLYCLLAYIDAELDVEYMGYEVDFNSIRKGINKYKREIRIKKNNQITNVNVLYYSLLFVYENGNVAFKKKKIEKNFIDFNDYYDRLYDAMDGMVKNANDEKRKKRYGLVTTISRGYDATCCAVIAKKLGATMACTFKSIGKHCNDCGDVIAEKLGYEKVFLRNPDSYKDNNNMLEAEVVCSGELGSEISMASFYDIFSGNVVFTGERGDSIWDKNQLNCANNEYKFQSRDASLGSCERRLWIDYISCPLPLFGATAWPSICKISNSKEMQNWAMNNDYDRPIPRRIIEEAGIDRCDFGIKKYGAGFSYSYDWKKRIMNRMSPESAESFRDYLKCNQKRHIFSCVKFYFKVKNVYLNRLGLKVFKIGDYSEVKNPTVVRYLIPWAGTHMIKRYDCALKSNSSK